MATLTDDPFALACERLTRIADLRNNDLLDDAEYDDLRAKLLAEIKVSVLPAREDRTLHSAPTTPEGWRSEPSYGHLHAQIVKRIRNAYEESDQDGKQMSLRALAEIANSRALKEGESVQLERLVDEVYRPFTGNAYSAEDAVAVLDRVITVSKISLEIISARDASAAAKAIAGVAEQSAHEAGAEIRRDVQEAQERKKSNVTLPTKDLDPLWKSLVGEDVLGAMNGAASAVTVTTPFFGIPPFGWAPAIVAAVGAVIGGGVQSGAAYGRRKGAAG